MDLQTWIAKTKVRKKDFAFELGISTQSLYRLCTGKLHPSKILANFICHLTEDEVDYKSLRGENRPRKPKG